VNYNFCTYFDSNYLYRGLALYYSIKRLKVNFRFWILCFDNICYNILEELNHENIYLINLAEFEAEYANLKSVKSTRSKVEYYWTSTPFLIKFILKSFSNIDSVTYLDADLLFFSKPIKVYENFKEKSIYIVPHRFGEKNRDKAEKDAGKYNVGFMIFKNDNNSKLCLEWWSNQCIDWCYDKNEDNKYGDQKYLDEFPRLFDGVQVSTDIGIGLGEWNLENYNIKMENNFLYVNDSKLKVFHFNCADLIEPNLLITNQNHRYRFLYFEYVKYLNIAKKNINQIDSNFNSGLKYLNLIKKFGIKIKRKSYLLDF